MCANGWVHYFRCGYISDIWFDFCLILVCVCVIIYSPRPYIAIQYLCLTPVKKKQVKIMSHKNILYSFSQMSILFFDFQNVIEKLQGPPKKNHQNNDNQQIISLIFFLTLLLSFWFPNDDDDNEDNSKKRWKIFSIIVVGCCWFDLSPIIMEKMNNTRKHDNCNCLY